MAFEIKYIEVDEILLIEASDRKWAKDQSVAKNELREILKQICSNKAFTIGELIKLIELKCQNLLISKKKKKIKRILKDIIIKNPGDNYTSRELHQGWKEVRQFVFLFISKRFYYFDPEVLEKEKQKTITDKNW